MSDIDYLLSYIALSDILMFLIIFAIGAMIIHCLKVIKEEDNKNSGRDDDDQW